MYLEDSKSLFPNILKLCCRILMLESILNSMILLQITTLISHGVNSEKNANPTSPRKCSPNLPLPLSYTCSRKNSKVKNLNSGTN